MEDWGLSALAEQFESRVQAINATLNRRRIARWSAQLPVIAGFEEELTALGSYELRSAACRSAIGSRARSRSSASCPRRLPWCARRGGGTLNMRHFDVQMLGGIAMHHRSIAEMQTGEGKTLTATLPMYLSALAGKGRHLATVNDYLARRDAEWMRPIYEALGMTVGVVETQMSQSERRKAYACDITYGTAKEFGFDFLRDRLLLRRIAEGQTDFLGGMLGMHGGCRAKSRCSAPPFFCLVDEADSILIDEARTPLIISALPSEARRSPCECYKWAAAVADQFDEDEHYEYDHEEQDGRTDGRRPAAGARAAQAGGDATRSACSDLRIHRAGDQGRARILPRPPVRRPRRRDRDRRRVHRAAGRRAQVAGRHPPGRRSQREGVEVTRRHAARPRGSRCRISSCATRTWPA